MIITNCTIKFISTTGMTISQLCESISFSVTREMAPIYTMGSSKPLFPHTLDPRDFMPRGRKQIAGSFITYLPLLPGQKGTIEITYNDSKYTLKDVEIIGPGDDGTPNCTLFIAKDITYCEHVDHQAYFITVDDIVSSEPYTVPTRLMFDWKEPKCECGAEKCGFTTHSDWCPKYKKH